MTERLLLDGVACRRGGREVFAGVGMSVAAGEAVVLRGPNGTGKTSLIRLIAGLLPLAAGRLDNPFATALLGTDAALKPDATLAGELGFWARLDGAPASRVSDALARFDLAPLADLPCRVLSAGQRRRAALARVWVQEARLWLLDEPSVGLDDASVVRLADACTAHLADGGLIVAATHVDFGLRGRELRLA